MAKIILIEKFCVGHGLCEAAAPSVYELDDEGYCKTSGEVPDALLQEARAGAEACPERALTVE
jgi:ferredoxin